MHYFVTTPEMSEVIPICDDGTGPKEYFHAVASVDAPSKSEAKKMAIRHPDLQSYVEQQRGDGCSPFSGLKAEPAVCPHGRCFCQMCNEECPECEFELAAVSP